MIPAESAKQWEAETMALRVEIERLRAEIEVMRQSRAQIRAEMKEECARVAEREEFWDYLKPQAHIAAAIRAQKD